VSRLILNCTLNERLPHQPLPQLQFCFTSRVEKSFLFLCHLLKSSKFVFSQIPFHPHVHCGNLQIRIDITNTVGFDVKVDMFRLILMPSSLRFQIRVVRTIERWQSPNLLTTSIFVPCQPVRKIAVSV